MGVEGKSLTDVFAPVASEMDSFMGWMVANRAARLKKEGRENLFTDAEIAAAQKLNEGVMPDGSKRAATYKQVFEDFARFKKAVLDFAQEGGIIDPESRSAWENADYHYVLPGEGWAGRRAQCPEQQRACRAILRHQDVEGRQGKHRRSRRKHHAKLHPPD